MLFAVSDVVWQALIGAIVTVVLAWMSQRTKNAVEKTGKAAAEKVDIVAAKADIVAAKTEEVKTALEATTTEAVKKLDAVVSDVSDVKTDMAAVKHATNGMKKQLEDAAYARGVKSETDKSHGHEEQGRKT